MCRRISDEHVQWHAEQFVELGEHRETQIDKKPQLARAGKRADKGKVIKRFVKCQRRIESERKEGSADTRKCH